MSEEQGTVSIAFRFEAVDQRPLVFNGGIDADVNFVSEEARASNTSFGYSGRHDHGALPKLKSSGPMAKVVQSLQDAKRECDVYLTTLITQQQSEELGLPEKKPRLHTEEEEDASGSGALEGEEGDI